MAKGPSAAGSGEAAGDDSRRRIEELEAALAHKTALLRELDHRAKNNLQVVASLLLLKSRRIKDPASQRALSTMAERIAALSGAQRALSSDGDFARFDIGEFIGDLTRDLAAGIEPGQVELTLAIEPVFLPASSASPLALLVNELVANALRHAFPEGRSGRLSVRATGGDVLRLVVEDDGIGLPDHPGSDESFGKVLIAMLARQLRGTLTWEDAGPGTRAILVMPLEPQA